MSQYNVDRLDEVLQLLLLPNYNIASTSYFDLLLTHIADNAKKNDLNQCKIYQTWVLQAVEVWERNNIKPCQAVATFILKLIGIFAQNELHFEYWRRSDIYDKLCSILQLQKHDLSASVKTAYVVMLCNFLEHWSGREWIKQSGIWKDIVNFAHSNHTMYVARESKKFLASFLNAECQNKQICEEVILAIAAPLINSTTDNQTIPALEDSYMDQNRLLCTTLDLITSILEETLFVSLYNPVPLMFVKLINLEARVKALFEACHSTRFLKYVHKLLILIVVMKFKQGIRATDKTIDESVVEPFRIDIHYICILLLSKKCIVDVMRTFKFSLIYWKKIRALCEFQVTERYRFEHQVIAILVLPLCSIFKKSYIHFDLFDMYLTKLFDVTSTTIQRLAYNIRDVLLKEDVHVEQICKSVIEFIQEIINIMDRDIAVIAFQTMCHVLKNYVLDPEEFTPKCILSLDEKGKKYKSLLDGDAISNAPDLLSTILHTLATMTEKFNIKWQECVETICILSLSHKLVTHPTISAKICVQALKLCKLAIQNFMPPNLVLLIDSDVSHMSEVGTTLFKRLHDPHWEIQDSVLEVLHTIAVISEHKYPAFQNFLLEEPFLQVSTDIITSDNDSYVRASALQFIAVTVRINQLWDKKLSQFDLLEKAVHIIHKESEAIVRREAVLLINELYIHRRWPKSKINAMSHTMTTAAVLDLHWEVKVNALKYWKHFIHSHLTDQGMLDGSFPNVTFSKEHRKIVSLNEMEIKQRLNKALDELEKESCLGVLLVTLKDDSDFEVCKTAAQIIKQFQTILLKYKMNEPLPEMPLPKDSATIDSTYVKPNKSPKTINHKLPITSSGDPTNVIEEIVDATDMNLLASIYNDSMKIDHNITATEQQTLRDIRSVTKQDFLQTIFNTDIEAYIREKENWLMNYTNSFQSTLDDILTISQQSDVNSMDCY